jgi:hypothetical protein
MVGGALPQSGALSGHGDALGEHGVDEQRRCEVGSSEGARRSGDHPLGVGVGRAEGREERVLQGLASGSPSSLRSNQIRQGSISGKILCWALKGYAGESPWSVCIGRKRKKIELAKVRVCMAEFKIQI